MKSESINKVYNLVILDESGSMEAIKKATIQGFNELIQSIKHSLKEDPEIEQYVNFYSFNGAGIKEQMELQHASHLKYLTEQAYCPDHMTPLYDAIGHAVNKLKNKIDGLSGYSVLVTILTDGEENASKEYTHEAVVQLITSMRTKGWVFTYIGANHNVEKTAFNLNINNHLHFHATEEDTQQMFVKNSASRAVYMNKLKSGRKDLDADFFKEEEEK
jgi:uncharacterized protein YegL